MDATGLETDRGRMPVGFVSHGAPTLALDAVRGADLARWGAGLPRPSAIVVISAHWQAAPVAIGTSTTRELIYDFGGFAEELYRVRYDAPAAGALAARIGRLLPDAVQREERGWDHGVWVPLMHMAPQADVPLLQLSLPSAPGPEEVFRLGARLAPLRDEGVLLLASGGLVHNLGALDWREASGPPAWAQEFEDWARRSVLAGDVDALIDFEARAPALRLAHPTVEHWLPLLFALGAAGDAGTAEAAVSFPVSGFEYGSLSRTSIQFG